MSEREYWKVVMSVGTEPPHEVPTNLFMDTTIPGNWVLKYWDGDEWVRMDGGADIPNGMIERRHLSEELRLELGLSDDNS